MTLRDLLRRRAHASPQLPAPPPARFEVALVTGAETPVAAHLAQALGEEFRVSDVEHAAEPDIIVCEDLPAAGVRALRELHPGAALLATTNGWAPDLPEKVVDLLRAGADSCVANPSPQELAAHVHVLARRRGER